MVTIEEQIAEVLRLDEAATKGPWTHDTHDRSVYSPHDPIISLVIDDGNSHSRDLALIARYRTIAPELARECQRLRGMLRSAVERRAMSDALAWELWTSDAANLSAKWNDAAPAIGIPAHMPEHAELWPVYRAAFEAELARLNGGSGG